MEAVAPMEAAAEQPPEWLPDGWIMEIRRSSRGSTFRYYTSPITGFTFCSKSDVIKYLFSEADESPPEPTSPISATVTPSCTNKAISSFDELKTWLPSGWFVEIRAGGKNSDRMYKFYVDPVTGNRFHSKEAVLSYLEEGKPCNSLGAEDCDTISDYNILSQLSFFPDGLPDGWLKETVFRRTGEGVIRRDAYYTDTCSGYIFRTLKDALRFIQTGERSKHTYKAKRAVAKAYEFEKSASMPPELAKRLELPRTTKKLHSEALLPISLEEQVKGEIAMSSYQSTADPDVDCPAELLEHIENNTEEVLEITGNPNVMLLESTSVEAFLLNSMTIPNSPKCLGSTSAVELQTVVIQEDKLDKTLELLCPPNKFQFDALAPIPFGEQMEGEIAMSSSSQSAVVPADDCPAKLDDIKVLEGSGEGAMLLDSSAIPNLPECLDHTSDMEPQENKEDNKAEDEPELRPPMEIKMTSSEEPLDEESKSEIELIRYSDYENPFGEKDMSVAKQEQVEEDAEGLEPQPRRVQVYTRRKRSFDSQTAIPEQEREDREPNPADCETVLKKRPAEEHSSKWKIGVRSNATRLLPCRVSCSSRFKHRRTRSQDGHHQGGDPSTPGRSISNFELVDLTEPEPEPPTNMDSLD